MRIYLTFIVIFFLIVLITSCRSTAEKRLHKDIIGINEQLYDLEKNQIKDANRLKKIETSLKEIKKIEIQSEEQKKKEDVNAIYKEGYKKYLEQNYDEAIKMFSQLTKQYKTDTLVDNALYWEAESHSQLNQKEKALDLYLLIYRYFPFSNKADYALYKIGLIYLELKNYSKALLAFDRLVKEYPDSDLYKTVSIKIKELKSKRRRRQ